MDSAVYFSELGNLLVSIVGIAWMWGGDRRRRDPVAHLCWLIFWIATLAFYAADILNNYVWAKCCSGAPAWVPQLGLYVANAALLTGFGLTSRRLDKLPAAGVVALALSLVVHAAWLDITTISDGGLAYWNQALTCVALMPWAVRLRERDPGRSIVIALYALIQLPLFQWSPDSVKSHGSEAFLHATFVLYLIGKVPLISVIHYVIQRPDPSLLAPYKLTQVSRAAEPSGPKDSADLKSWQVFVSYAFENVEEARAVSAALARHDIRAFVASDDLSSLVGAIEWGAVIDNVLDSTKLLVVVVTAESLNSRWVEYEWRSVHNDVNGGNRVAILPVCVGTGAEALPRALKAYSALSISGETTYETCAKEVATRLSNLGQQVQGRVIEQPPG